MQIDVYNKEGKKTGRQVDLTDTIFAAKPNNHVIWLSVKQYLAAQRQGTNKAKERGEVAGSTRKLHRQKGTGGSRKGSIRNPLYKGGGTVFGPKPRNYQFKLNRKVKDLAKIGALTNKASENKIWVIEDNCMEMDQPGTKKFLEILGNLKTEARSILFVTHEYNENVTKSVRNAPAVKSTVLSDIHTYDIIKAGALVLTESSAKVFSDEGEQDDEKPATVAEA